MPTSGHPGCSNTAAKYTATEHCHRAGLVVGIKRPRHGTPDSIHGSEGSEQNRQREEMLSFDKYNELYN